MAGTKEIRTKIASVKSTQKITKAMQMVATSKMRRAQDRMRLARPYADKMRATIGHLTEANPDYRHPFMVTREPKSIGIIVISTDRGLCGGLNANIFKSTIYLMREWQAKGADVNLCLVGSKGLGFFRRIDINGYDGNDSVIGGNALLSKIIANGGNGDDWLEGGRNNDVLVGGSGFNGSGQVSLMFFRAPSTYPTPKDSGKFQGVVGVPHEGYL